MAKYLKFLFKAPPSELVKQELQAVTEGVAAFSLHAAAPRPLTADLSSDAAKGLAFKVKQERGERNSDSESHLSPKLEVLVYNQFSVPLCILLNYLSDVTFFLSHL